MLTALIVVSVAALVLAMRIFLVNPILSEMKALRSVLEPTDGASAIGFVPQASEEEDDEDVEEEEAH